MARRLLSQRRAEGESTVAIGEAQHGGASASQRSDSMVLSPERRARVRQRIEPLLKEYNEETTFLSVFVDSTREYLAIVVQLADSPVLLKFRWVDFISTPDDVLRNDVRSQLVQKLGSPAQTSAPGQAIPET